MILRELWVSKRLGEDGDLIDCLRFDLMWYDDECIFGSEGEGGWG